MLHIVRYTLISQPKPWPPEASARPGTSPYSYFYLPIISSNTFSTQGQEDQVLSADPDLQATRAGEGQGEATSAVSG